MKPRAIIYNPVTGIALGTVALSDDASDAEIAAVMNWQVGPGRAVLVIDETGLESRRLEHSIPAVQSQHGIALTPPVRCVVIDATGPVGAMPITNVVMADPTLFAPANKLVVAHDTAAHTWMFNGPSSALQPPAPTDATGNVTGALPAAQPVTLVDPHAATLAAILAAP